ncbi:hypothetical protein NVP1246O_28 [Vibrio phage 1.246.O._10N.261.54.E10]|nr:hypothetical protein NVP1246O_28 [Vibrio phage 1.246.O._10N.261.54.E10]
MQEGDVLLFQTLNDSDMSITDGIVQMTQGLETAVYLSLFSPVDTYLNEAAETNDEKLSSQTEAIIQNKAQSSKNYQLLVQAVNADLKWLMTNGNAKSIDTSVSSDGLNRVIISITIEQDSGSTNITLPVEWGTNG